MLDHALSSPETAATELAPSHSMSELGEQHNASHHVLPADDTGHGQIYYLDSSKSSVKMASGTSGDDVFHAHTDGAVSNQIHMYGAAGNDQFYLDLSVAGLKSIQHGHHVFGGDGADKLEFKNVEAMRGTVVGRLDDFDDREDSIWIDGHRVDLHNLQDFRSVSVKLVAYQGQQWLEIRNDEGGRALYAVDGARAYREPVNGRDDEPHFLSWNHPLPDVLPEVEYHNPLNALPPDLISEHHGENVITKYDVGGAGNEVDGTEQNDVITTQRGHDLIRGGGGDDLIRSTFGNDTCYGGDGSDLIDGGKGFDLLRGGLGDDTIVGGADSDTIYGDEGFDVLYGGSEDDMLYGGDGNDSLFGGPGADYLHSGSGDDILVGGLGNDTIIAAAGTTLATGGEGEDIYMVEDGGILTIVDFNSTYDRLDIAAHFEDPVDLVEFTYSQQNPDNESLHDLIIEFPSGGGLRLVGAGDMADQPWKAISGWENYDSGSDPVLPDPPVEDPDPIVEPDDPDEDIDDAVDSSDDGGEMGMGLMLAILGGLAMLGGVGGGFGG